MTSTSRWDPDYEVIKVRGPTHWIRNQKIGKERKLNRSKLTLVSPDIAWDLIEPRPKRQRNARDVRANS